MDRRPRLLAGQAAGIPGAGVLIRRRRPPSRGKRTAQGWVAGARFRSAERKGGVRLGGNPWLSPGPPSGAPARSPSMWAPAVSGSISEVPASPERPRRAGGLGRGAGCRGAPRDASPRGAPGFMRGPSRPSSPLTPFLIAEKLGGLDAASEPVARPWPEPVPSAHGFSSSDLEA